MALNDLLNALEARLGEPKHYVGHGEIKELIIAIDAIIQEAEIQELPPGEFERKSQWRLDRAMSNCPTFYDVAQGDFAHRSLPRAPTKPSDQEDSTKSDYVEITSRLIDVRSKLLAEDSRLSKGKDGPRKS